MSATWIKKLNEDNGRLHKENVLSQALTASTLGNDNATYFLGGLKTCYNSYLTFGVKQVADTVGITGAENPWEEFFDLLQTLSARRITGHAARDAIAEMSERFDSEEWNMFLAPIIRRDMRCGVTATTFNKMCKGTAFEIPIFSCQLATSCEGRPEMRGVKRLEPKLDGVRALFAVSVLDSGIYITCYSRNGKPFENFRHIEEQILSNVPQLFAAISNTKSVQSGEFSTGFILDGEVVSESFQALMKQAQRKENVDAGDSVFHVFDIIPLPAFREGHWNAQQHKRIELLEAMLSAFATMPNVELLDSENVDLDTDAGKTALEAYAKAMVAANFEGIMIKNLDAPYLCDRTTSWLKWKPTITVDLQLVGVEEGTGRNKGRLGALVCAGEDAGRDITVNVGSGFDDKFRAQIWADITGQPVSWQKKIKKVWVTMTEYPSGTNQIGRTVEVLADAITQNQDGTYSLRFPRFSCFRDDK